MTKLIWPRAALRIFDPARYQGRDDFDTPDGQNSPNRKNLTPAARQRWAEDENRRAERRAVQKAKDAVARAAHLETVRLAKAAKAEKQRAKVEARQRKVEMSRANMARAKRKRVAVEEYQKTPEYAAKLERERANMAAMTKTHLEVWTEGQEGLKEDRASLLQRWKDRLLGQHRSKERG